VNRLFETCASLESISIPAHAMAISDVWFAACVNASEVIHEVSAVKDESEPSFHSDLSRIEDCALLSLSSLKPIWISLHVAHIEDSAFQGDTEPSFH
jgi:hypothetical protein